MLPVVHCKVGVSGLYRQQGQEGACLARFLNLFFSASLACLAVASCLLLTLICTAQGRCTREPCCSSSVHPVFPSFLQTPFFRGLGFKTRDPVNPLGGRDLWWVQVEERKDGDKTLQELAMRTNLGPQTWAEGGDYRYKMFTDVKSDLPQVSTHGMAGSQYAPSLSACP